MGYTLTASLLLGITAGWCGPAAAQAQQSDQTTSDEVVVTGKRESALDLARLLKAREAFEAGRAAFAPTSSLYYQIRPASGVPLAGIALTLRRGDQRVAVPIDAEGRFTIPHLPQGGWTLLHNRGAGRIAVRALVISIGATESDRPLGDLRLQCRVGWELKKADYSLIARSGFGAMGGCSSSRFAFYFHVTRTIRTVSLNDGAKVRELPVTSTRSGYRAPLGDRSIPNTAMIHVRYD